MKSVQDYLSWWEYQHYFDSVDYIILGCGIVGLSTAIELKSLDKNLNILILDKKTLPLGASTRNAGFACFGSVSEIVDDINNFGEETARKLIKMRVRGLQLLQNRVASDKMHYHNNGGSEIFAGMEEESHYNSKIQSINRLISDTVNLKNCFSYEKGLFGMEIHNKYEGSLYPQKMIAELEKQAIALGIKILNGIDILNINKQGNYLSTTNGNIPFMNLIVCTNGFSKSLLGDQIKISPARNQVLITKPIEGFSLGPCFHMDKGYVYFREIENRLLIGGGRNIDPVLETTTDLNQTDQILSYLKNIISTKIIVNKPYEIDQTWSGILGVGDSKMPMVEKISKSITIAIRMGGMGVAIGSLIGRIAASISMDQTNADVELLVK